MLFEAHGEIMMSPIFFSQAHIRSILAWQNIAGSAKNANCRQKTTPSPCAFAYENAREGIDQFAPVMERFTRITASYTKLPATLNRR